MWKPLNSSFYWLFRLVARFRRPIEQIKGLINDSKWELNTFVTLLVSLIISSFSDRKNLESQLLHLFEKYGL